MSVPQRKFVMDCDTGIDDAHALLMALAQPDVDLIGVTTVFGNTSLDNTVRNTLRVLTSKGRTDVPVFRGCEKSMLGVGSTNSGHHGSDGLGDIIIEGVDPVDERLIQDEHAATALVRMANQHPGEITLVVTGPLTNIAMALHLDAMFGKKLKEVYIMGGTSEAKGNTTPCVEFNFFSDPEAAYFVLEHIGQKVTLAVKEVCEEYSFSREWYEKFIGTGTRISNLIYQLENHTISKMTEIDEANYMGVFDQVPMATAINNHVAMETEDVYMTVELHGQLTRGHSVIDWKGKLQRKPNVRLIKTLDKDLFGKLMFSIVEH